MAYEKQTWVDGEVITAEKLNHMEDGIEGNVFIVNLGFENETLVFDKTYNEILEALQSGKHVLLNDYVGHLIPYACYFESNSTIEFGYVHGEESNGNHSIVYTYYRITPNNEIDTSNLSLYGD